MSNNMQNIKEEKEIEKLKLAEWEMQLNSNFYNPQDAGGEDCGEHGD